MPRRIPNYSIIFETANYYSTLGSIITSLGFIVFILNIIFAKKKN
jgi:heme/copper-type cytochrome/quinol oxidase subunit 1